MAKKADMNWGSWLLGIILMAVSLYFLVMGWMTQQASSAQIDWWALLWYAIGFALWGCKHQCGVCKA